MSILSIDAGTTGVTALVVSADATILARGYSEFPQHFPVEGWVEHDPNDIWAATISAVRDALATLDRRRRPADRGRHHQPARDRRAVGPRDSRRPAARDRVAGPAYRRASATSCAATAGSRGSPSSPGCGSTPTSRATKLSWIALNEPQVWAQVESGRVAVGTVDSYLVARLTRGLHHVTDASNASRTLLYDIHAGAWSQELCDVFRVPMSALPEVVPSYGVVGNTDPSVFLGLDLPIAGIAGDQQAALFGQACFATGSSKCTYGTGSFVLVNTGDRPVDVVDRAAHHRRLAAPGRPAHLRARGRRLRHRGGRPVAARRAADHRERR